MLQLKFCIWQYSDHQSSADAFRHHAAFCWVEKLIVGRNEVCGETGLIKPGEKRRKYIGGKKVKGKLLLKRIKMNYSVRICNEGVA